MKSDLTRTTIYFDPLVHRVLKMKSAQTDQTLSEIVNEVLRHELLEDAEDLETFRKRATEDTLTYESLLKKLKANGKI